MSSHRFRFLLWFVSSAALAVPVAAGDRLLFGVSGGAVMEADTAVGAFYYFTPSIWRPIWAMAADRQRLYTTNGDDELVWVNDLATGVEEGFFWPQLGPIRDIAASGGTVFVGTGAGVIAAFRHDGTPLGARTVPVSVRSLVVHREFVLAAGDDGTIHRAPLTGGGAFEPFADVGLSGVRDMCVVEGDLAVVDAAGTVVRVSGATGARTATFTVGKEPRTMAGHGSTLLFYFVGDGSGWIQRFDARTGVASPDGFQAPDQPLVMLVIPERTPSVVRAPRLR
jgi:hypothetical protein